MTATQLQFRRGTAAQLATFTGAPGEVVVDTTNNRIVVCDGATAGGFPAATLSEVPALLSYQGSGFVNRFRNGDFTVAQRGAGGTVTAGAGGGYTLDGWIVVSTGANISWQLGTNGTAGIAAPVGSNDFLFLSGATGITDVVVKQRIESSVGAIFAAKQVTVQLTVYAGTASPAVPTLTVRHANSLDNWSGSTIDVGPVSLQSLITNQWKTISYTFTASGFAGGIEIAFDFGALPSGGLAIAQADIRVTPGVASGLNSSPPLPELRPIATETMFCQRYFKGYTNMPVGINLTASWPSAGFSSFPATMRATPTLQNASFTLASGSGSAGTPSVSVISGQVTTDGFALANGSANWSATAGAAYFTFTGQFTSEL